MPLLKVIVASTRPVRTGRAIGDWFTRHAVEHGGFDVELVDLAEVGLPFLDEPEDATTGNYVHQHTKDWSATIDAADAFVFVMPEYNYAFNAPLKNALDFLHREWAHKPVGFVSYGGLSGGLRAVELLKPVVTKLRMVPAGAAVTVFRRKSVAADGTLTVDSTLSESASAMLEELGRLTQAMSVMRSSV
ncbi:MULTISPECIES: NADPH-dependent FMN reductase [Streptosporangium]|uniref:NAD(P)H-dependent FMN reductase n=1 Tax=Streptosporangium brasiliense TaxID=47480 RepID=A0ABT9QX62_9ACTN|nr:NAD(P)H-dependent oxidoreductase [Streptosporangium brasiliense]MDP9860840.1 NAD(P)H-dependent FMN reductase [Streptosporangium brasiliense]